MRQPRHPYSPEDEEPQGASQSLLALCLSLVCTKRLPMSHRCPPCLVPLPIADRVAEHQHGVDVLPTPTHASPFEACFDDHFVGTFDTPRTNGPACCLIGRVLHVRFTLLQVAQFLLGQWTRVASGQPCQVR